MDTFHTPLDGLRKVSTMQIYTQVEVRKNKSQISQWQLCVSHSKKWFFFSEKPTDCHLSAVPWHLLYIHRQKYKKACVHLKQNQLWPSFPVHDFSENFIFCELDAESEIEFYTSTSFCRCDFCSLRELEL